jgi:hypothetical protein
MATAQKFNADGRGNGFPFCPTRIDVDDYYDWITLGGTRKGNTPTEEEIANSFKMAMKFYWNLASIKFSAAASASASSPKTSASVSESINTASQSAPEDGVKEPMMRVCGEGGELSLVAPLIEEEDRDTFNDSGEDFSEDHVSEAGVVIINSFTNPNDDIPQGFIPYGVPSIVLAMYENGNFVGYGIGGSAFTELNDSNIAASYLSASSGASNVFADFEEEENDINDSATSEKLVYASIHSAISSLDSTFAGLGKEQAEAFMDTVNFDVTPASFNGAHFLIAKTEAESSSIEGSSCSASASASASFDGFDFWEYA